MIFEWRIIFLFFCRSGSLPPSPADSGVSDVDSSSSGHTSNDETKARLQPTPGKYFKGMDLQKKILFSWKLFM